MPFILSQFLEASRWLGALLVLAVHATNLFVNLGDVMTAPHAAPFHVWWFFSAYQLGHQAVVGFFAMSGYLVGGAVLTHLEKREDFLREYLIHRFARIYVVVAPALLLTAALDTAGRSLFGVSGIYGWPLFQGHDGAADFFANLLNLQSIAVHFYGTNGPLWSLACEFWYYITFPLLLMPLARQYSVVTRIAGFALGLAIFLPFAGMGDWFGFGFVIWTMGALARLARRPLFRSRWLALGIYAVVVILVRLLVRGPLLEAHPWAEKAADVIGAALFLNVMTTLRFAPDEGWRLLAPPLHRALADFSFSLYSIHMPALVFLRAAAEAGLGADWPRQLATPLHWAAMAGAMTLCVTLAYVFARLTEARTKAARLLLRDGLDRLERFPPKWKAVRR